ncbi:antitoxin [Aggregatibacter kilianii]|uniref:antitoxin n=1 Tax=Aggregatibacter kilianii TaxID=2025884 RepID=UPI000D657D2F|nr:antitoxin [Aggregatibacter kilianii]
MLAKVFQSGNSQAVRIPVDFRFDVDTVEIFRQENGDVVLRPVKNNETHFLALFDGFDEDFISALEDRDSTPPQEREQL